MNDEHLKIYDEYIDDNAVCVSDSRDDCIRRTIAILNGANSPPLDRPDVRITPAVGKIVIFVISAVALFLLLNAILPANIALVLSIVSVVICLLVLFKRILIFIVQVYQRYAHEQTRRRCCFTPSCSEYMLLSISKYGTYIGFVKGVFRLFRCHYPNGGVDEP